MRLLPPARRGGFRDTAASPFATIRDWAWAQRLDCEYAGMPRRAFAYGLLERGCSSAVEAILGPPW